MLKPTEKRSDPVKLFEWKVVKCRSQLITTTCLLGLSQQRVGFTKEFLMSEEYSFWDKWKGLYNLLGYIHLTNIPENVSSIFDWISDFPVDELLLKFRWNTHQSTMILLSVLTCISVCRSNICYSKHLWWLLLCSRDLYLVFFSLMREIIFILIVCNLGDKNNQTNAF